MLGSSNSKRRKKGEWGRGRSGRNRCGSENRGDGVIPGIFFSEEKEKKKKRSSSVATVACFFLEYHTLSCSCSQSD